MPRRKRCWLQGGCYHFTHRCHDGNFFLKPAYERDIYMSELREAKKRYKFELLNFIITSNHVHHLVYCRDGRELEQAIQYVHGRVGQYYNIRHDRKGAFWSDRYHAVLIESGEHLSRCMYYIDFNMLRNGVVAHPKEWKHSGYHELSGDKTRYRVINFSRLLKCLAMKDPKMFRLWYKKTINSEAQRKHEREAYWTEATAVGSWEWLESVSPKIGIKRKTKVELIENKIVYDMDNDAIPQHVAESKSAYFAIR